MSTHHNRKSIAIIGAGLVGEAVLLELAIVWIHRHNKPATGFSGGTINAARHLEFDRICITARSEAKLSYQLQKTENVLRNEEGVRVNREGPLTLVISCGNDCLQIEAETLDILPDGLTYETIENECFRRKSSLYSFLAVNCPRSLVIGVNLASVVAYGDAMAGIRSMVLAWILTTLKRAANQLQIETMAFLGTTGLGGLGTNIAWTHQSSQEMDAKLTNKVLSAYGILGVLDRMHWDTDFACRLILLTPGSVLGYDYLDYGPVKYFSVPGGLPTSVEKVVRRSGLKLPLYAPVETDLQSLSDLLIDWDARRIEDAFLSGAKIKCGENGEFSPLQFACITHAFQMGFNSGTYIARIMIDELAGNATGYNQIPLGAGKVVEPSAQGQNDCNAALTRLAELEFQNTRRSAPVYPALGSPRAQKEIVSVDLLHRLLTDRFEKPTLQQLCEYEPKTLANDLWHYLQNHSRLLAEITAVIPVISPTGRIFVGPHAMFLDQGISRTSDLDELRDKDCFREFAALGAVDLRPVGEHVVRKPKVYETGIEVLISRARFILAHCVNALPLGLDDECGSAVDYRIRHWRGLTTGSQTVFDPVFFVIQFLGGQRPYQ